MDLQLLKDELHKGIDDSDNERLLLLINNILRKYHSSFIIPEKWNTELKYAEREIEEGNFSTLNEFEEKYGKWLEE